jgi:hypothetical protein
VAFADRNAAAKSKAEILGWCSDIMLHSY